MIEVVSESLLRGEKKKREEKKQIPVFFTSPFSGI